ncbi:putative ribonuclease H-like domain-containing protein [Tanacetum coccineum]
MGFLGLHLGSKTYSLVARTLENNNKGQNINNNSFGNNNGNNKTQYNSLSCKNYGMKGHTLDRCFELTEYPYGFKKILNGNFNNHNTRGNSNNNIRGGSTNNVGVQRTSGSLSFTNDQILKLMSLIGEKGNSGIQANIAGHPNGTIAKIRHVGNLRLTSNVVMFDVLVKLEYTFSFLSVNKMIKDSKLHSKILYDFPRFFGVLIAEFATGGAVNLTLKMKSDMIIKNLDVKPKIDAMMRDFLENDMSQLGKYCQAGKKIDSPDAGFKPSGEEEKMDAEHPENEDSKVPNTEKPRVNQEQDANVNNTNNINIIRPTVNAAKIENNVVDENIVYGYIDDPNMPNLEKIVYFNDDEEVGAETHMNNLATTVPVSPILTTRVHKDHPLEQIIGDIHLAPQTRRMTKNVTEHEPKKVIQALTDPSWIEAMQDEILQFKLQKVYRNKKDDRGIMVRNKARLVAQGYTQKEGIDYDEVFALVAMIEAIRLFLAYASFMNFTVYQMDVKSAFLYGTIEEKVYVCQPPGFEDLEFPNKVYKVEKDLYGLHQAPRAWYETLSTYLLENGFRRGTIDKTLFIKKDKDDAQEIPDEFYGGAHFLLRVTASTPMETNKVLLKDEEAADVDVHLYRSMIGSLMYLTASRPDIMFVVCACASDYAGDSLDRKSTTGGCQFLGRRLISWQCKKQTIVANSTTEAKYVAAANCYGQTQKPRKAKRTTEISQSSGPIPLVTYETVIKEWEDRMERAITTASSLEAEQDSGSGPRCQDTILGGAKAQIRFEAASKQSNDPPLSRVNTLGSGEDNMKLKELMEFCTKLSVRAFDL